MDPGSRATILRLQVTMLEVSRRVILHVINDLPVGGAQTMLLKLLSILNRGIYDPAVVSLMGEGALANQVREHGITLHSLNMSSGRIPAGGILKLARIVRATHPTLIQGWMYHSNVLALLASFCVPGRRKVVWNIRHSLEDLSLEKISTAQVIRFGAVLSSLASVIVYNSRVSAIQHENLGYCAHRVRVIPNGFDCDKFKPSEHARSAVRRALGVPENGILIGMVARYHPMKDHATFLQAAAHLSRRVPDVHFLLAGPDVLSSNSELWQQIVRAGLERCVHILGERTDTPQITAALDIATLSSAWGEGFPNVIGEAMACGVPCVVTQIGDSAWIVGKAGEVVPPGRPDALADAWARLCEVGPDGRRRLGMAGRERVVENFSLAAVAAQYQELYDQVTDEGKPAASKRT